MKVLIIAHSFYKYNFGGAEYQLFLMAQYLIERGYDIHYLFLIKDKSIVPSKIENINLHPINENITFFNKVFGRVFIQYKDEVSKIIEKVKPDLILHRNLSSIFYPIIKNSNIKTILHLAHKKDVSNFSFKFSRKIITEYLESKYRKYILKNVDYIIGQAKYQDDLLKQNFRRKCDLIIQNFHPYPKEEILKSDKIKIVWIANWKKWKQPEVFIALAENLRHINAEFIMIGRKANDSWSEKLIGRINKIDNLNYLGEKTLEETNEILSKSHIFVNTSLYEGFPNTFIQAWMRKVVVVSLNVDPDSVLKNNKIGFHSQQFDMMADNVKELIENKKLREEYTENGQKYSFENHALKNVDKIINLIGK